MDTNNKGVPQNSSNHEPHARTHNPLVPGDSHTPFGSAQVRHTASRFGVESRWAHHDQVTVKPFLID